MLTLQQKDILGFDLHTEHPIGPPQTTGYLLATPAFMSPVKQHGNITTTKRVFRGQVVMMEGDAYEALSVIPMEYFGRQVFQVKVASQTT